MAYPFVGEMCMETRTGRTACSRHSGSPPRWRMELTLTGQAFRRYGWSRIGWPDTSSIWHTADPHPPAAKAPPARAIPVDAARLCDWPVPAPALMLANPDFADRKTALELQPMITQLL